MFSPRTWLQGVDGAVILGMIPGSRTEEGREEEGGGSRREGEVEGKNEKPVKMRSCGRFCSGGWMPPTSEKCSPCHWAGTLSESMELFPGPATAA